MYQQFSDLDELMLALIRRQLADLAEAIGVALAPVDAESPASQLGAVGHAYVSWGLDHPGPYSVVFDGQVLRQLTREQEAAMMAGTDLFEVLTGIVAAAIGPDEDAVLAGTALWAALHGVVALRIAKPAYPWPPLSDHVDAVLESAWRAARPIGEADRP